MYYPSFRKNRKNVPILSKSEINNISENFAFELMPHILDHPQPFDIDLFLESYLHLSLDYQYLSNDGRYLGMTVFNDTNKVIVYIPDNKCADYIQVEHGTVIIDNSLLSQNQEHRYRFTLGHECGHWIFHSAYFAYNPNQLSLFEIDTPFIQCRETNQNYMHGFTGTWDDSRWMEWQADKFSAGILMPQTSVRLLLGNSHISDEFCAIRMVSDTFNVSEQAAYLRLCDLEYIHPTNDNSLFQQLCFL